MNTKDVIWAIANSGAIHGLLDFQSYNDVMSKAPNNAILTLEKEIGEEFPEFVEVCKELLKVNDKFYDLIQPVADKFGVSLDG